MKKILLSVLVLCCSITAMNAQVYLGTGLGFNYSQDSHDGDKLNSTIGFGVIPEVGYAINDRWDVGIALGFGMNTDKVEATGIKEQTLGWGVAPYARFAFFQFGKFEVLAKAQLYVGGYMDKTKPSSGSDITNSDYIAYGLNIAPMMIYNLNDRISLHAQLNFCSLDLGFVSEKESDNSVFNAGLGIDSNNLFNTGALTIGFTYSF